MLIFITFTIICWYANVGMGKFMLIAIRDQQLLDKIFGWQKMLANLYGGGTFKQLLGKFLGDCNTCFLHLVSWINFLLYFVLIYFGLNKWVIPVDVSSFKCWVISFIWAVIYVSIAWQLSMKMNNKDA